MDHGAVSPGLLAATRETLEALRSSGDVPASQLNLLARGLDALMEPALSSNSNAGGAAEGAECGREKKLRGPRSTVNCTQTSSWGGLPEEILVQVAAAAVARSYEAMRAETEHFRHETWWQARAVCRRWKRVFSGAFTDFDMGKTYHGPPHGAISTVAASDGLLSPTPSSFQLYKHRISDRAVFGAYGQWLADRFPNLKRICLAPYNAEAHDRLRFILHSVWVYSWIPATVNALRPLRHLTHLEWGQCSPLDHATFQELSNLTTLESLILNPQGRARGDSIHQVKEESLRMLTTLANLHTLRVTMFENERGRSTRAVTALTSLTNLTDIHWGCNEVHSEHLVSLAAALPRLKRLNLVPPDQHSSNIYLGDDGYSDVTDESLMRLTTLQQLKTLKVIVGRGVTLRGRHRLSERMTELTCLECVRLPAPPVAADEDDSDGDDSSDGDDDGSTSNSGYDSELCYSSEDPLEKAQRAQQASDDAHGYNDSSCSGSPC